MTDSSALSRFASVSSSLVAVLSKDGVVQEANAAFSRLARGPDVVVGKSFADLVHADDRASVVELLGRIERGASAEFRGRLGVELGKSRVEHAHFEATRGSDDAIFLVGIPSVPTTETGAELEQSSNARRKVVEQQLADLERQVATARLLSQALKLAPMILWANDAQGWGTHLEGGGLAMVGLDKVTDPSKINIFDAYKDRPDFIDALRRTLSGETIKRVAAFGAATFETWYVPSRNEQGEVDGFIGLSVDVSARVKGETELREKLEYIERQSATIRSLATPIVQVWEGVLCLPVIGIVDSGRAAEMMQTLLEAIVEQEPRYVVVDLTGVEIVDTSTAELLLRLFQAARLMGTAGILCGIRPAVAQAITGLGLDLGSVHTMRSLQHALEWCIERSDAEVEAASQRSDSSRSIEEDGARSPRQA